MKKIAIVGYGASTIGFLYKWLSMDVSKIKQYQIDIYDKNLECNAGGLGGLAYDGKLNVGQYAGSDSSIPINLQWEILNFIWGNSPNKHSDLVESDIDKDAESYEFSKLSYKNDLYLFPQQTVHLGTDQLKETNKCILDYFKQKISQYKLDITFSFDSLIAPYQDQYESVIPIDHLFSHYEKVIFAAGRSGAELLSSFKDKPEYVESNTKVDIGIRFELPHSLPNILNLDNLFYEWKIKYKTKNNMFVRTFCHNPNGYVVTEKMNILNQDISIVNGHSKHNDKSSNTNFAILVTQQFTEPFNDSVLYGKIISQQANLLAGSSDKVILQTLGDFKNKKRTKKLFRVIPTLSQNKYVLGDLTYVLPAKTYQAIVQFIDKLSIVIPEIGYQDNLIYGVQTKFYGMKMKNSDKIKFIGDCSGHSRSIIAAACTGYQLVKQIIRE